ncbi:hypothetical protein DFQ04_0714 [Algoriphagus boseongensis]|uniref:Uncharacterized protein n=1 Tax=Algoriphagus boseongensis TaxID=1442587 RepID=A0A4R6T9N8_9BACT|nr:hypothetical protein [Algoriphagus boseongensis]TDQ18903.1 hypothetical protein DFQ04_0714 [Algoriphagus boseongensis]
MDIGNLIYIVAVVGYFIYQLSKKKQGQEGVDMPESKPAPQKGMTFEELLKEIRNAQNPPAPEPVAPKPQPVPVSTRPAPRKKVVVQEEEDDEIQYYEGAFDKTKTNPYQAFANPHSIPSTPLIKMDYDALQNKKVNPYAELLKNPKTLKDAVVVSEILKPKYF